MTNGFRAIPRGLALAFLLAGCKGGDSDTSGLVGETDETDETDDTDDTDDTDCAVMDPETDILADWTSATNLTVSVACLEGVTGLFFGMAETASDAAGWYGENCLDGACHEFSGSSGSLSSVDTPGEVNPGSTTLFDNDTDGQGDAFTADGADRLTYLLQILGGEEDGNCYVWGHDVAYYANEGCGRI